MFVVCKYMLFGGWMVVGWYIHRAVPDEREEGRAGGRETERRYLCVPYVCIAGKNERNGRIEIDVK